MGGRLISARFLMESRLRDAGRGDTNACFDLGMAYSSGGEGVEIALLDENAPPPEPEPEAEPKPEPDPDAKPAKDEDSSEDEKKPLPTATPEPKPDAEKPDPKEQEPEKKPEPEKKVVEAEKVVPAQELVLKKSIAVRQHVKDEKQPDNPDAEFIAEQNNRVTEQTQARITSNDQNDPEPTPGSSASGAGEQPGDSHETRIAESEDRPGEEARAPSDEPAPQRPKTSDALPNAGAPEAVAKTHTAPTQNGATSGVQKPPLPDQAVAKTPSPGSRGQAEQQQQTGAPELVAANQSPSLVAKAQAELAEQEGQRARKQRRLPQRKIRGAEDMFGLGASGTTASGVNLNLTPGLARNAIGTDQLSRERRADSQRRRSAHLGSWKTNGIERWRSAIENYVPSVKPGNQTALNSARSPFGTYLAIIHNRLHPIFADWFLASLDSLDANNPMNRADLSTNLEIQLDQDEGRIVRMGVTKHSGVTAFDIAALDSVQRASPFGPPPREIVSPDGSVYLHWEFHRNPAIACTTYNARPYMLKVQPKTAPPTIPAPKRPDDEGSTDERHGAVEVPSDPGAARL